MTLYDLDWVKDELGNMGVTNVTDTEINRIGPAIEAEIRGRTNHVFAPGDTDYARAQLAANEMVISKIAQKFPDLQPGSNTRWRNALEILQNIVDNDTDETIEVTGEDLISLGQYQTMPENPNAVYRFATRSRGGANTYKDIINGFR
jgi:hypothetical protein